MESINRPTTLGQYLEQGRQALGLSYRQCAIAADMPLTTAIRLFKDDVESPQADHVQRLVRVLELDEADAFAYIGITPPNGLPSIAPYLRATTGLKGENLNEATEQIQKIIDKHNGLPPDM